MATRSKEKALWALHVGKADWLSTERTGAADGGTSLSLRAKTWPHVVMA